MLKLLLVGALSTSAALAGPVVPHFLYNFPDIRLETLPKGRVPYLTVMDAEKLQAAQQKGPSCAQQATSCSRFEWSVPFSSEAASRDVARDLRAAWQRFEDRTYWHAMVRLNSPGMLLTHCTLDLGQGVHPGAPDAETTIARDVVPAELRSHLPASPPHDALHLDTYGPFPLVPKGDYCDDVSLDPTPMFLPGTCYYAFGAKVLCIEGDTTSLNPLAPRPLWFNDAEARRRVQEAVQHAHDTYLPQYLEQAGEAALTPRAGYFPLAWAGLLPGQGAVIAPVANASPDLSPLVRLAAAARRALGGLVGANAEPYYFQGLKRGPSLNALLESDEVARTPPGVWKLEEFKRRLPVSSLPLYERFGYAVFFQVFGEQVETTLPEPPAAKPLRPIAYAAFGLRVDFPAAVTPIPTLVPVQPYFETGLPFVGPRVRFAWSAVPEGYALPRVSGTPLNDFASLLR